MNLSHLPDRELIAACLSGSAPAWEALIDRYEALIFNLALRMGLSRADAEDVFQNVCLLLLDHLGDLREESRLAGWLVATTRREAWRLHRQQGGLMHVEVSERFWENPGVQPIGKETPPPLETTIIALEERQRVQQALKCLPERCRRLLWLLYCQHPPCSYAETAQKLQMPLGAIGPTRARCLEQLRKILEEK